MGENKLFHILQLLSLWCVSIGLSVRVTSRNRKSSNKQDGIWRGKRSFGFMGEIDGLLLSLWICLVQGRMWLILLCQCCTRSVAGHMLCQRLSCLLIRRKTSGPREPMCCDCGSRGKTACYFTTSLKLTLASS